MTARISTADVEAFSTSGNTFRILEDGDATDGRVGVVECILDPGWPGPPQHIHNAHDETFFVLEGNIRFSSGADSFVATPGQLVTIPAGDPHTFGNADADTRARLLGSVSPSRFINFFRELRDLPVNADGRADAAELLALMKEYDSEPYR